MPRPFQQPHPPIWIAAISSEESFTYAARNGFNVMIVPYAGKPGTLEQYVKMYRKMWADSGHAPGTEQVQMSQFCCISPSRDQAHEGFERIMTRYLETFAEAVQSWEGKTSDQYPGYDKMVANILAMTPQKIIENKAAGYSIAQELRRLYGHENFAVQLVDPKGQDKLARLYSVQHLFAEGMIFAPVRSWADMVITQVGTFPKGKHDDLVDTVSQSIRHLRDLNLLARAPELIHEVEENMAFKSQKEEVPLYPI
jgi:predicted phage terminase large subunit-like protein